MFEKLKSLVKFDAWENAVTALGTARSSLYHHQMVVETFRTTEELEALYVGDPIARRIILEPHKASLKKGVILSHPKGLDGDAAQDQEQRIKERFKELRVMEVVLLARAWGHLYGRGGILLGAIDGSTDPKEPLRKDSVRALPWLRVLACDEFYYATLEDDVMSPNYGRPKTWRVIRSARGTQVETHTSRILLTGSVPTSLTLQEEQEWREIPILQAVLEDLRNYNSAKTSIAQMLSDASQAVLKILNLSGILAGDSTVLRARIRILEMARALHIMPIEAGTEDFQYVERTFSGVSDTFDRLLGALSSAVGWPQTHLFGRSPAGENATGESDRVIWDDLVTWEQEQTRALLQELLDLIVTAEGLEPGWTVYFPPLRQMSEKETAEHGKLIADTDAIYIDKGVLDETTIAKWRFGGDEVNLEPVMLSAEDVEALEALQEMDRERALNPEPPEAPMDPEPKEPELPFNDPTIEEPENDEEK